MPNGGDLIIRAQNENTVRPIELYSQTLPTGNYVKFVVKDNGSGIPSEAIDQIFEPFFSTKTEENGTGLGLSMVYGFVQQYGGYIDVKTQPGEGTEFYLYFPVSDECFSEALPESSLAHASGSDIGKILLIEDNPDLLAVTGESLQLQGYEIITATSADEAEEILNSNTKIDLFFSDIVLPGGKSGIELAEELIRTSPKTPVILATGYTKELNINSAFHLLTKPYSRTKLLHLIEQCLNSNRR